MRLLSIYSTSVIALAAILMPLSPVHAAQAKKVIAEGSKVSMEYTVKVEGGKTVDSNVGRAPFVYTQGKHQILPALEKALAGLSAGDEKEITLKPEDAYGQVDPNAFQEVHLSQIPEDARKVGQHLIMQDQQGHRREVRISKIQGDTAVIDMNHPLAGKTLHFDVKIVDVQ